MRRLPDPFLTAAVLLLSLLAIPFPARAGAAGPAGLRRALVSPTAERTVFFVRGMSCRACTLLIDRKLNGEDGVHWARFNYPLRTLVAYHEPEKVTAGAITSFIASSGELEAVVMKGEPASSGGARNSDAAARWKGGSLSADEARRAPEPFVEMLRAYMIEEGTPEWMQVAYEIAGERVRNAILEGRALSSGYEPAKGTKEEIPAVIAKDFYYPAEKLDPTPVETAMARFIRKDVILGDEGEEGRHRFDAWLFSLWQEIDLDFRGEILETAD